MDTIDAKGTAEILHLNLKRVQQLAHAGRLPARRIGRKWLFLRSDIELLLGQPAHVFGQGIELSARNQLRARIAGIRTDGLMAEVRLAIGDQEIVSVITRASAERLGLAVGSAVFAVVKATEVMIGTGGAVGAGQAE